MSATRIAAAYIQCSACYRVQFVGNITEHWSFLPFLLQNSEVPLLLRILGRKHWFRLDANAEVSRYLFQLKIANLKFTSYCTDRVCLCYFLSLVQWRLYQWPFQGYHFDMPIYHQYWSHLLGRLISFRDVCGTFRFVLISPFIFMLIPKGEGGLTIQPLPAHCQINPGS